MPLTRPESAPVSPRHPLPYALPVPKPRVHAAVTLGLAALMVARSRRWRDALPILVAGVLVDVDHLVDLGLARAIGGPKFIVLPLHAWEWVFGLLARNDRAARNLAGGLATHLALDQLNDAIAHPLFYWISVRALHRFRADAPLVDVERFRHTARWMHASPRDWL